MNQNRQDKEEKKNKGYRLAVIHLSWILVIILLAVAGIVGIFHCTDDGILILSTISTATSIILSIIAIVFTLFQAYKADQYNDEVKHVIYESIKDFTRDITQIQQSLKDYKEVSVTLRKMVEDGAIDSNTMRETVTKIADKTDENLKNLNLSNTGFWFDD